VNELSAELGKPVSTDMEAVQVNEALFLWLQLNQTSCKRNTYKVWWSVFQRLEARSKFQNTCCEL